jgi:hypothetical protein
MGAIEITTCESVLNDIDHLDIYLSKYRRSDQKSAGVELLFSKAIAFLLHLRFFSNANNDPLVIHKVVWNGNETSGISLAPREMPDTNIFARDYDILLEITQKTRAKQWSQEFASGIRHLREYIETTKKPRDKVYLLMVAPEIYVDTYNSVRGKQIEGFNIALLTFKEVRDLSQICDLSIGLRHIDILNLLRNLSSIMIKTDDFEVFKTLSAAAILNWKISFLKNDRLLFLGVKGYRVFKDKNQKILQASDILTELNTKKDVKSYFDIIGEELKREDICKGMLTFGFAYESGLPQPDMFLSVASDIEVENRMREILESLKEP